VLSTGKVRDNLLKLNQLRVCLKEEFGNMTAVTLNLPLSLRL
jgi:hypothetical protein